MDNTPDLVAKCQQAEKLKQMGNAEFKQKQYTKALRCYHKANLYLSGLVDDQSPMKAYSKAILDEETSEKVRNGKFSIYMNMSQVYIYQSKFDKANDILAKAQEIKINTKLKYRRAVVYMNLAEFDKSRQLFTEVISEDPAMKEQVEDHLVKLKQMERKCEEKSKNMFAKFFQS